MLHNELARLGFDLVDQNLFASANVRAEINGQDVTITAISGDNKFRYTHRNVNPAHLNAMIEWCKDQAGKMYFHKPDEVRDVLTTETGKHQYPQLVFLTVFGYNAGLYSEVIATYVEMLEQAGVSKRETKYLINKIIMPLRENLNKVVANVNNIVNGEFARHGKPPLIDDYMMYKNAANDIKAVQMFAEAFAIRPTETVYALEAVKSGEFVISE